MAQERVAPDALVGTSGYQGTPVLSDVTDDPDSPDANFHVATNNNVNVETHCGYPAPSDTLVDGADLQEFRALVRRTAGSGTGDPDARIELWENGVLVRAGSDAAVTSDTGQVIAFTWNATEVTDPALTEIKVIGTKSGGSPTVRSAVDVGAMEWNAEVSAALQGAGTVNATAKVTAAGLRKAHGDGSIDGAATVTASATLRTQGVVAVAASATVTAAATLRTQGAGSISGTATVTADGTTAATHQGNGSISAAATVTAAATVIVRATAAIVGTAAVVAAGTMIVRATASINASASVTANATVTVPLMAYKHVIEDATGDLVHAGYSDFADVPGESIRDDGPIPATRREAGASGQFDRWDGAIWIKIPQPPAEPDRFFEGIMIDKDIEHTANNVGPILIDRTTGNRCRLFVDNGVLDVEILP